MRKNLFNFTLLLTLVVILCSGLPAWGIDYKITKVVEIGPAAEGFMSWPLRWSPDGKWLAYFRSDTLMLSDTLGNSHAVKAMNLFPSRFEWLSNEEIVGYFDEGYNIDSSRQLLMQIDVTTGADTIIEKYVRYDHRGNAQWFQGPWRTVKGNVYYDYGERFGPSKTDKSEERRWVNSRKGKKLTETDKKTDYILHWGKDGLYKVTIDGLDSTRISPEPYKQTAGGVELNPSCTHALVGGTIIRMADSAFIVMDTMLREDNSGSMICGFVATSFDPVHPEIIFQLSCNEKNVDSILSDRIGIYNYSTGKFIILNPIEGAGHCIDPVCSPKGNQISLLADRKAFIIYINRGKP